MGAVGMGQSERASETSLLASFSTSCSTTDRQPSDQLDQPAAITFIVCNPLHNRISFFLPTSPFVIFTMIRNALRQSSRAVGAVSVSGVAATV